VHFEAQEGFPVRNAREERPPHGARATSNSSKSSGEMTSALADHGGCFKKCCMKAGHYDGSERGYYFRED
jgi:hypothetical protein